MFRRLNISKNIESHFNEGKSQLNKFTNNPEFVDLVKKKLKDKDNSELDNYLRIFFGSYSENINSIILYDVYGEIISEISDSTTTDLVDNDKAINISNQVSDQETIISDFMFSDENDPIIAIDNKFYDGKLLLGVIRLEINLNYLEKYVFDVPAAFG